MRRRGQDEEIRYALTDSPLGRMLVARTDAGICAVAFSESDETLRQQLAERYPEAAIRHADDGLPGEIDVIRQHLSGEAAAPLPALDTAGTAFEQRVWAALRCIPRGTTKEYGELAASLGVPLATRAVGAAIGKNPVAVLNPCHRVLARGGLLHRYRWGPDRKEWLLEQEGIYVPGGVRRQGDLPWAS